MASSSPSSALSMGVISAPPRRPAILTAFDAMREASSGLSRAALRWQARNLATESWQRSMADVERMERGDRSPIGFLFARVVDKDGRVDDLGLISCRVVTNAGVNFIIDAFQGLQNVADFKYHGVGTGSGSESVSNTSLGTELSTQYASANTRPTGTAGEASGQSNTFETSATITVSSSVAITEHGIFSRAATGGGVLLDRSVFAAVNLQASESLQATYSFTLPSGG